MMQTLFSLFLVLSFVSISPVFSAEPLHSGFRAFEIELDSPPALSEEVDAQKLILGLQKKAQENVAYMTNLLATQKTQSWRGTDPERMHSREDELAIYDDHQVFREIKQNGSLGKEKRLINPPNRGVVPLTEWYDTLRDITFVPLTYLGMSTRRGFKVHVYRFQASWLDNYGTCSGYEDGKHFFYDCSGQIVADEQFNTLEIVVWSRPPKVHVVMVSMIKMVYDFFEIEKGQERRLLPSSVKIAQTFKDWNVYFASAVWTNYREFGSDVRIDYPNVETEINYAREGGP